jgi:hypothetical protein
MNPATPAEDRPPAGPACPPQPLRLASAGRRYAQPARLIRPSAAGYLYLAVQTAAQHRPGPVLGRDQRRQGAAAVRGCGGGPLRRRHRGVGVPRRDADPHARPVPQPDVTMLIQTTTPETAASLASSPALGTVLGELAAAGARSHLTAARNIRRIADVDHRPGPLFLFNHFLAPGQDLAVAVWEHLAAWYQRETRLRNSVLLAPAGTQQPEFTLVNHASFEMSLPALAWRQFARRSYHTYVRASLAANQITAAPGLYRLTGSSAS